MPFPFRRVAIFVDAGYLYAAGSVALAGSKQPRNTLDLDQDATLDTLRATAATKTADADLLRIYWYDGEPHRGATSEQQKLADADDVKLRLGAINLAGQQKGVDSLVVTDLIELARNQAISDAVLLSGDEDVRVGVQLAQIYGVRVHLIGIEPSSNNQSRLLWQEADTKVEWSTSEVAGILSLKQPVSLPVATPIGTTNPAISQETKSVLEKAATEFIQNLSVVDKKLLSEDGMSHFIPAAYDGQLLRQAGQALDRWLDTDESRFLRDQFRSKFQDSELPG